MKNILTIFKREIKAYFNSPIGYIFIVVFILISSGLYMTQFFIFSIADMRRFFFFLPIILCGFLPAVSMRLWAEDRNGNTLELLLTFPVKTYELVLGKFFASFLFYITSLLATFTIPIMIGVLGKPDQGVIMCGYLGAILMGGFYLALGIFISGFCKDQIVSFILAMTACFGFFILGTDFAAASIDGWIPGLGSFLRGSLGLAQHFNSFQKGVIDSRDFLYFIIGTAIFLILNGFWLEGRLRPRAKTIFSTACLISLGIFVLINSIFADLAVGRFDFTEGKMYTISLASREVLQSLKAPAAVKVFISPPDKMPSALKTLERDIRDKLDEFRVAAGGNFTYKVFHLEAATISQEKEETLEKSLEKKGIRPFQVRSVEADEVGVKLIYSALSIAYKEKSEEIISRILPQDMLGLEYKVISRIYKMSLPEQPSVALVAPYRERVGKETMKKLDKADIGKFREDAFIFVPRFLRYEGYEVKRIKLTKDEPIPKDCKTLVVLEPGNLNERQRFEINKFLVNGGSVFLGVQRYTFDYNRFERGGIKVSSVDKKPRINPLIEKWGLSLDKDFLMDTSADVVSLTGLKIGPVEFSSPVKLPIQLRIIPGQMNQDVSITSRVATLLYLWGSALNIDYKKLGELGLETKVLLNSSKDAWKVKYHVGNLTAEDVTVPAAEKRKRFPLAVMVEGQFPDAFKGKQVPRWPQEEGQESYEKTSKETGISPQHGKLILIGCSAMFKKQLFNKGGHMTFFLNSIDAITLGGKLIEIRGKQLVDRSLKRISAAARVAWRIFTTFLMPVVLCVIGGLRLFMRKRSKWTYLKTV